jgi:DNA primase
MKGEESVLPITKEMFISIKKENINLYYEVVAKVSLHLIRNSIKAESKARKVLGAQSKRFQRHLSRTPLPSSTKSKSRCA